MNRFSILTLMGKHLSLTVKVWAFVCLAWRNPKYVEYMMSLVSRGREPPTRKSIQNKTVIILAMIIIPPAVSSNVNDVLSTVLIDHVSFSGNRRIDQKTLQKLISVKNRDWYDEETLKIGLNRIIERYVQEGLIFAEIFPRVVLDKGHAQIHVQVHEGEMAKFGSISIVGNTKFTDHHLFNSIGLHQGQPFNVTSLEKGIESIINLYSEQGHPMAEVRLTEVAANLENGELNLRVQIDEKNIVKIASVKISGSLKTRDEIVLRELPIQVGDVFDQRKIDQSFRQLINLGYFYKINPNLLEVAEAPNQIKVHARVTDARTGRINGVIGYAPATSQTNNNMPRLTGLIEANETNLFGTGRRLDFRWKSSLLKTILISYTEPWMFGKPISIGGKYERVKHQDQISANISKEKSASLTISARLNPILKGTLTASLKRIDLAEINASGKLNGIKHGAAFSIVRDSRDYFLSPTKGRRDHIAFEISRGDFKLWKLWIDLEQYAKIWENQVILAGLHVASAWGQDIPWIEMFSLGGANSLRGYDEDFFFGQRRFYGNFEYRLLMGHISQVFGFVDIGSVTKLTKSTISEPIKIGYGLGARIESKGGILRINYALSRESALSQGKIHVNLGASF